MGLLEGKKGLVMGVANDHSICWGIAQALHAEGADLGFTYAGEAFERRVRPLAESLQAKLIAPCDVQKDEEIAAVMAQAREVYGQLDIIIEGVAAAKREELSGQFLNTSRDGFLYAMEVSAYSLTAVARAASEAGLLKNGTSIITLTYHGSQQVAPNYNVMGVAKAALESSVRYLAYDLGPRGVRVNAISPGPVRTLSAAGVSSFRDFYKRFPEIAPLRRQITLDDIGKTAVWLCSDWASAITAEVIYVDAGAHQVMLAFD